MKYFIETLTSNSKSAKLPEEFNYFGKLIGSWKFDYIDHNISCSTKGEWHFSWVLEGMAVQDVIILPLRENKNRKYRNPLTEYGTDTSCLQSYHACLGYCLLLYRKNHAP